MSSVDLAKLHLIEQWPPARLVRSQQQLIESVCLFFCFCAFWRWCHLRETGFFLFEKRLCCVHTFFILLPGLSACWACRGVMKCPLKLVSQLFHSGSVLLFSFCSGVYQYHRSVWLGIRVAVETSKAKRHNWTKWLTVVYILLPIATKYALC